MSPASERRKTRRRPVLETFSIFVVIPRKGFHRLRIFDLSEDGIGFELDTDGESHDDFSVTQGQVLDVRLYLNQSLFLPIGVELVRVDEAHATRRIGGRFSDKNSKAYAAFVSFLEMLDSIRDAAEIENKASL
ncbi:MAG: hypothetical protein A2X94_11480 [Bdellovibrionales bacterium GWB1_55_8]|nr:MAG: hypothetical protein A2X94_11480 [Bdellovibrionales bacterium GWB1_55_8]